MGTTHVLGGALVWTVGAPLLDVPWYGVVVGLPLAMAASLGPDIDHPNSAIGRVVPWLSWSVSRVTTHRVQTHSLFFLLCVFLVTRMLGPVPCAALTLGWASHLLLDGITIQGIAWFWPLTSEKTSLFWFFRRVRPLWLRRMVTVTTNSASETVFTGIMCIGFFGYVVMRLML